MKRKKIRLKYKKERVLFSDVLPYEMPFIFSNRYFYRFLVRNEIRIENERLVWGKNVNRGVLAIIAFLFRISSATLESDKCIDLRGNSIKKLKRIPFTYRILHKQNKYRELTIINPVNQIQMVDFYDRYNSLMIYYTNLDRFSLRHPSKVACYFYYKGRLHHILLGKKTDKLELFFHEYENLRTYFSYDKYNNIYKFYEDYRYQRAEKKFQHLLKFDIQSCFDSIYTHSISWATGGGRDLYKAHFSSDDKSFASVWDGLMELMNYNETNGIVIGPEFSRIFAEVILQHIDQRVDVDLQNKYDIKFNKDYICFRYVDDFFFFYNDEAVREKAMVLFTNTLKEFKLCISPEKTKTFERPFITEITRAKAQIDELIDESLSYHQMGISKANEEDDEQDVSIPKVEEPLDEERLDSALKEDGYWYFNPNKFNARFKAILVSCGVESKDVINYTLARICRKLEKGLEYFDKSFKIICSSLNKEEFKSKFDQCKKAKRNKERMLTSFLLALLDSVFFLYSNNKRVNTTLKVLNILNDIIIALENDYVVKHETINRFSDYIRDNVFKKIRDEVSLVFQTSNLDENTQIETLYFLIILKSLRSKYHLTATELEKYLGIHRDNNGDICEYPSLNALSIIILFYYFGNEKQYDILKKDLISQVFQKYENVPECIRPITTELTLLTLDLIACPYIEYNDKWTIADKMKIPSQDFRHMVKYFKINRFMFTRWEGVDITKELNAKISQEVYS